MRKGSGVRSIILKVFATSLLLAMVLSLNAFANNGWGAIYVPTGIAFVKAQQVTRSGSYNYVTVQVSRVYPPGGITDNYTKCRTQLRRVNSSTPCSDVYTCVEGGYSTCVELYNEYRYESPVDLYFAGNNPKYDAYIDYSYHGN